MLQQGQHMKLMLLRPVEVIQLIEEKLLQPGWPFVDRFFHIAHFGIKDNKFASLGTRRRSPHEDRPTLPPLTPWPAFLDHVINTWIMETLKSESIRVRTPAGNQEYRLEEKDHGDLVG